MSNMLFNAYRKSVMGNAVAVWMYPEAPTSRWRRIIWRLRRKDRPFIIGWRDRDTGETVTDNFIVEWNADGLMRVRLVDDVTEGFQ